MAKRSKGTVGVIGLGDMGGAFARHLVAAGWRVLGFDIDGDSQTRRDPRRHGGRVRRRDARGTNSPRSSCRSRIVAALEATVGAIIERAICRARTIVETSTFAIEDKARAGEALRKAGHVAARLPGERHRRAGGGEGHRRLCERHEKKIAGFEPMFAGVLARGL